MQSFLPESSRNSPEQQTLVRNLIKHFQINIPKQSLVSNLCPCVEKVLHSSQQPVLHKNESRSMWHSDWWWNFIANLDWCSRSLLSLQMICNRYSTYIDIYIYIYIYSDYSVGYTQVHWSTSPGSAGSKSTKSPCHFGSGLTSPCNARNSRRNSERLGSGARSDPQGDLIVFGNFMEKP